jgi:DNA-binding NarL/FixJ family response regulator
MPRALRKPDDFERDELNAIQEINLMIHQNIEKNNELSSLRRNKIRMLKDRGWSMYGIAKETGVTPNTIKRILES